MWAAIAVAGMLIPAAAQAQVTAYAVIPSWTTSRCSWWTRTRGRRSRPIGLGGEPYDAAITPDGRYAYVTLRAAKRVTVIDLGTLQDRPVHPVGPGAARRGHHTGRDARMDHGSQIAHRVGDRRGDQHGRSARPFRSARCRGASRSGAQGDRRVRRQSREQHGERDRSRQPDGDRRHARRSGAGRDHHRARRPHGVRHEHDRRHRRPIDIDTHTVLPSIPVGLFPRDLAITPDGRRSSSRIASRERSR